MLKELREFFFINFNWFLVFGLGIAFSWGGPTLSAKALAQTVDYKIYLGPLLISGMFPVWIKFGEKK